jgi:hypothetical protein
MAKKQPTENEVDRIIGNNLEPLRKTGVLTVRPGYEIAGHQLTGNTAIVATVHTKKKDVPAADRLPEKIRGVPVDVREATAHQRLRAFDPAAAHMAQTFGRPEDKEPVWPLEREMPSGKRLNAATSTTKKVKSKDLSLRHAATHALTTHDKKAQIDYVPASVPLDPVTVAAKITAHVSPDAGLKTLESFLAGTKQSLVIGMYDFTSGSILTSVENALKSSGTLMMVLDNPPPTTAKIDQRDDATVADLNNSLGSRAKISRALVRNDVYASEWMFPYAYHIKVVVRDSSAMWLSSGNFNNTNQPDLSNPPPKEDRDWHVIIENEQLAKTFEAFLTQDYESAAQHQTAPPQTDVEATSLAFTKIAAEQNPHPPIPVTAESSSGGLTAPKTFNLDQVRITPLLTPDNYSGDKTKGEYLTNIINLISNAQKSVYIQLQYIESSTDGTDYDTLLKAIADQVSKGRDVRLIENGEYGEKWAEKMKSAGVDLTANIWMQPNVHNKGFVIDSQTVVVSSQNFSPAGVRQNRDAGVIIENKEIAGYFEKIFLDDWKNKAKKFAQKAAASTAPSGTSTHRSSSRKSSSPAKPSRGKKGIK